MAPPKGLKSSLPLEEGCLENLGGSSPEGFERAQDPSSHAPRFFQCSDKSCLRTPSLKKRVSDANLEGKKDSGMLKYIRLQVLAPGSEMVTKQSLGVGSRCPRIWDMWCQLAHGCHKVPLTVGALFHTTSVQEKKLLLARQPFSLETRLGELGWNPDSSYLPPSSEANISPVCGGDMHRS